MEADEANMGLLRVKIDRGTTHEAMTRHVAKEKRVINPEVPCNARESASIKEARLNWMLEAEMEAQNAGAAVDPGDPPRPTVTRSWAVETRLRRQLVAIPPPLRDMQQDPGSKARGEGNLNNPVETNHSTVNAREAQPVKRVFSTLGGRPTTVTACNTATCSPTPPAECHSPEDHITTGSRRSRVAKSHPTGHSEHPTPTEQMKAFSFLKMVGSEPSDASGKTRVELIGEYKRARRVSMLWYTA
ncbi:hypothetical protein PC122_g19522 [Phytophthora cactorum]|nr:hypothetical protein PC122_g19522 [Phytophthora cactorum]